MKKGIYILICCTVILCLSKMPVSAEETGFDVLYENAPADLRSYFTDIDKPDLSSLLTQVVEYGLKYAMRISALLIGYTVIASVFTGQFVFPKNEKGMHIVSSLIICLLLFPTLVSLISLTETYAEELIKFMTAFAAFCSASYLSCGFVTTAASGTLWLGAMTTLTETMTEKALLPLLKALTAATIADSTIAPGRLKGVNQFMKSTYLQISIIFSTVIGSVLTMQTFLHRAEDGLSVRSIRFAATQAIPVVGSLVSESLRTLIGTADAARKTGLGLTIAILLAITLPPIIAVIGTKIGISIAGFTSDLLGGSSLSELYKNVTRLLDFMLISIGICSAGFGICAAIFLSGTCL